MRGAYRGESSPAGRLLLVSWATFGVSPWTRSVQGTRRDCDRGFWWDPRVCYGNRPSLTVTIRGTRGVAGVPPRRSPPAVLQSGKLLTTKETAAILELDPRYLYRLAAAGTFTPVKTPGGQRRYKETEVMAFLKQLRESQGKLTATRRHTLKLRIRRQHSHMFCHSPAVARPYPASAPPVIRQPHTA